MRHMGGVEYLIIDEGSSDQALKIIEQWQQKLLITLTRRKVGSWAENTNHGIDQVAGEYICSYIKTVNGYQDNSNCYMSG